MSDYTAGVIDPAHPATTPGPPPAPSSYAAGVVDPAHPASAAAGTLPNDLASIVEYIHVHYPSLAAFFNIAPEVTQVLIQAAQAGLDENELQARIEATTWWQQTTKAQREFEGLQAIDPAQAKRLVQATAATLSDSVKKLGLSLTKQEVADLSLESTKNGWTDTEQVDHLLQSVNWAKVSDGDLTAYRDTIKQDGAQFLMPITEAKARDYAVKVALGELTDGGLQSMFRRQAKARFAWMGDLIDQGIAPRDFFTPLQDTIAKTLELDPASVNLMDPRWLNMMEVRDAKGNLRAATQTEVMLAARKQSGWAKTSQSQDMGASLMQALSQIFGRSSRG